MPFLVLDFLLEEKEIKSLFGVCEKSCNGAFFGPWKIFTITNNFWWTAIWQAHAWFAYDNSCIADYAMPEETVIVGDERGHFLYRSGNETRNVSGRTKPDAIALTFARDKDKSSGIISVFIYVVLFFRYSIF